MHRHRPRLLAAAVGVVLLVAAAPGADAHTSPRTRSPEDGSQLAQAPAEVWVEFTQAPSPSPPPGLTVDHECAGKVDSGNVRALYNRVSVDIRDAGPGRYTARWEATSPTDGHTTRGSWSFVVSGASSCGSANPGSSGGGAGAGAGGPSTSRPAARSDARDPSTTTSPPPTGDPDATDDGAPDAGSGGAGMRADATDGAAGRVPTRGTRSVSTAGGDDAGVPPGIALAGVLALLGVSSSTILVGVAGRRRPAG